MPYYKVVRKNPFGQWESLVVEEKGVVATYAIGQLTMPPVPWSRLFVVDTIESAFSWLRSRTDEGRKEDFAVMEVEVTDPIKMTFITDWWADLVQMTEFWESLHENLPVRYPATVYDETVTLVTTVIPIRMVAPEEETNATTI